MHENLPRGLFFVYHGNLNFQNIPASESWRWSSGPGMQMLFSGVAEPRQTENLPRRTGTKSTHIWRQQKKLSYLRARWRARWEYFQFVRWRTKFFPTPDCRRRRRDFFFYFFSRKIIDKIWVKNMSQVGKWRGMSSLKKYLEKFSWKTINFFQRNL